jgi:hypothetical protein
LGEQGDDGRSRGSFNPQFWQPGKSEDEQWVQYNIEAVSKQGGPHGSLGVASALEPRRNRQVCENEGGTQNTDAKELVCEFGDCVGCAQQREQRGRQQAHGRHRRTDGQGEPEALPRYPSSYGVLCGTSRLCDEHTNAAHEPCAKTLGEEHQDTRYAHCGQWFGTQSGHENRIDHAHEGVGEHRHHDGPSQVKD